MFREPADQPPTPGGVNRPTLFWGSLAGLLVLMAVLVPTEWTNSFSSLVGEGGTTTAGAWSDRTDELDKKLRAGESLKLTDAELARVKVDLQVRRLSEAGPMNASYARKARAIFRDFNQRVAGQELEGSKDALRNERNRQLAEALPRLDREKMAAALERLQEQLDAATASDE